MIRVVTLLVGLVWLALLAAGAAHAKGRCVVEAQKSEPFIVDVAPKGAAPFQLRVAGVPVSAHPAGPDQPALVEVKGALAFEASAPAARVPWRTRRAVQASSGMVAIPKGVEVSARAHAHPRFVEVALDLGQVRLRWLSLPCDALTLDDVARPDAAQSLPEERGQVLVATKNLIHLRQGPGSGADLELDFGSDPSSFELHRVHAQGAWVRVSSHWLDGTTLVGWANKEDLKPAEARNEALGEAFPVAASCSRALAQRPGDRVAKALVTAGTQVFATRYLGPWATVRSTSPVTVRWRDRDDWVEIVEVPGIVGAAECPEHSTVLDGAWIPRNAVKLPADSPAPSPAPR